MSVQNRLKSRAYSASSRKMILLVSLSMCLALSSCGGDDGAAETHSAPAAHGHPAGGLSSGGSVREHPFRGIPNLGGTCYFNTAIHILRKLDRPEFNPNFPANRALLREYHALLDALEVQSGSSTAEVIDRTLIEHFMESWNGFLRSSEFANHSRALLLQAGDTESEADRGMSSLIGYCRLESGGHSRDVVDCAPYLLGYEVNAGQIVRERTGNIYLVDQSPRHRNSDLLLPAGQSKFGFFTYYTFSIGEEFEMHHQRFRVIACQAPGHGHTSALVIDQVAGVPEIFHYDDAQVTRIPSTAPMSAKSCSTAGGSMVIERLGR